MRLVNGIEKPQGRKADPALLTLRLFDAIETPQGRKADPALAADGITQSCSATFALQRCGWSTALKSRRVGKRTLRY